MRTIRIQNNQWSLDLCSVLCIVQFAAPFAQKCDHLPPNPNPYVPETAFSLQKYTHTPPQRDENLMHWTKRSEKPRKSAKTHLIGAYRMSPRDIFTSSHEMP